MSRTDYIHPWIRRTGIEVAGWLLVALGVAALVLPGPGLLLLGAGLAVLSLRYVWAKRLLRPVLIRAFAAAKKGVQNRKQIAAGVAGSLCIIAAGIVWGNWRSVPGWWPLDSAWWLPGGWGTGATLIGSGLIAMVLIGFSYHHFRVSSRGIPAVAQPLTEPEARPET